MNAIRSMNLLFLLLKYNDRLLDYICNYLFTLYQGKSQMTITLYKVEMRVICPSIKTCVDRIY